MIWKLYDFNRGKTRAVKRIEEQSQIFSLRLFTRKNDTIDRRRTQDKYLYIAHPGIQQCQAFIICVSTTFLSNYHYFLTQNPILTFLPAFLHSSLKITVM